MATRAVAEGIAFAQALHRRVFVSHLGHALAPEVDDDTPGLTDMVRFGVSLGRAARQSPASPNLFTIGQGAEDPLAPEILGDRRWFSLSEQVHRAGALLLLSAPTGAAGLEALAVQLDGVLLVGDAAPPAGSRVLGEVQTAATMRTPAIPMRAQAEPVEARRRGWLVAALAALVMAPLAFPAVRARLGLGPDPIAASLDSVAAPPLDVLPPIAPRITSDAAWSTELRFLNAREDAQALVSALGDSLPVPTWAPVRMATDSAAWYRVLLGAFPDSLGAENFLAALRTRGMVPAAGGAVTHVPFALVVDSAFDDAMARVRIAGYRGRGLPAYALRDSSRVWRIYVGAFTEGAEADRMKLDLNSLNIQSALVVRVGSTS